MSSKRIGFWTSTALVIGNIIGSGIFLLPSTLALYGGISLFGWLFASLGAVLIAVVFGNLSRYIPNLAGGPYIYTKASLGEFPAYLVAWSYWVSIWSVNAAIAIACVGYLGVFFPILNTSPVVSVLVGLSIVWFFTWINTKSIKTIGFIQVLTTILKIIPIVLIASWGIFYALESPYFPDFHLADTSPFSAITITTTLTFFAFLGIESATIPSTNIENPDKTIRRATIAGTLTTIVLYVLSSVVIMTLIPSELLSMSRAPFADAAALMWGEFGRTFVALGAIIATLGALNGWILIQGQIPLAAARDNLFPKIFGKTNKDKSPVLGIIISSILISVLMIFNYSKTLVEAFSFMTLLSTLSVLVSYLFSTASYALLVFKKKDKHQTRNLILAMLTFSFSMWIIFGCGHEVVFWGFILLMSGIPFYVWLKKTQI